MKHIQALRRELLATVAVVITLRNAIDRIENNIASAMRVLDYMEDEKETKPDEASLSEQEFRRTTEL